MIYDSWNDVNSMSISNFWNHTGILSDDSLVDSNLIDQIFIDDLNTLNALIVSSNCEDFDMTAKEFLEIDDQEIEEFTVDYIVELFAEFPENKGPLMDDTNGKLHKEPVLKSKALSSIDTLRSYLEGTGIMEPKIHLNLKRLRDQIEEGDYMSMFQTKIADYIKHPDI